ncbi:MAG TPA: GxxExxY protein [Fimbriimonadaceae bacterium]|nr:GxxExxY protein [Fimbriimonadaceae bacterium]
MQQFVKLENPHSALTSKIIAAAIEVHRHLGPGLLESTYQACLRYELAKSGLAFRQQQLLPIVYKEVQLEEPYKLDFVVEGLVILELKAVESLHPIHEAQLLTYMKLSGLRVGLLINFNVVKLKDGIKRLVL